MTTTIIGASPRQESLLREILAGLGESRIESVRVRPAGAWARRDPAAVVVEPRIRAGTEPVRGDWEANLLAEAFADRSRRLGLPRVSAFGGPNGIDHDLDGGSAEGERLDRSAVSPETLARKVEAGARKSRAEVLGGEILEPNRLALAVELMVDDPVQFLRHRARGFLAAVEADWGSELIGGAFVRVVGTDRRFVWSYSLYLSEDGGGGKWGDTRPDLTGCYPRGGPSGPPGRLPLPCPLDSESQREALGAPVVSIPPGEVTTKIIGATPKQRLLLTGILAGLGPTPVEAVEFVEPEKDMRAPPGAVALNIRTPRDERVADWHAELIAHAFYYRSLEARLASVVWYSTSMSGQALGEWLDRDAGDRGLSLAQAREIAERVREAAVRHDAEVLRLELLRPQQFAFFVVLQADDPAAFLYRGFEDMMKPLDDLRLSQYGGRSVEVRDREGKPVMGSGGWFFDATNCAPVIRSHALGERPQPCAAAD